MWASRSFLSRGRAPLLCQLHAVRRRVNEPLFVLGDGDRRDDDSLVQRGRAHQCHGGHRRTSSLQQKQHFLYLVLDDMKKGCCLHKIDIDAAAAADDDNVVGRLPGPPVFRMQFPNLGVNDPDPYVAVLGSNIIAIGTGTDQSWVEKCGGDAFTVAFDLKTAALTVLHGEPTDVHDCYVKLAVAAGNKLCVFPGEGRGMECLELQLQEGEEDIHGGGGGGKDDSKPRWRWSDHHYRGPDTDGICAHALALHPLMVMDGIYGHALHPGGRAFFVSSFYLYKHADGHRAWDTVTFSYDTERDEWTHHGDWKLPFHGQAHYDCDLGVWIGLHYHCQRGGDLDTDGYLCCSDVPQPALGPPAHSKVSKEKLFLVDIERHIEAKLVSTGGGGNFCLVEILMREGVDGKGWLGAGDKCLLRLTTFRVRYGGDDGELTITARRPVGEYKLSRYTDMFEAQAFWM